MAEQPAGVYRRYGKRALDLGLALLGLLLLAPVFGVVALLVYARLGTPVLFRQARPGLDGAPFTLIKFRTMRAAHDSQGRPLPDAARLTGLGRRLRAWSLDELPELLNVVRGEMSLVGPRPLLMHYLPHYTPEQMRRHAVRPGITGWAQVHGRNLVAWEERFALDVWYVDHLSLALDLRILWQTVWMALRREGVNAPGQATMEEFRGSGEHG
jgi:lipopolysaccharide/colanic/teichoic acid biosynthesis glycosyltransferase